MHVSAILHSAVSGSNSQVHHRAAVVRHATAPPLSRIHMYICALDQLSSVLDELSSTTEKIR